MAKVQLITANDISVTLPEQQFNQRVIADGGTVRSKAFMQRVFEANKDLLADTELLFVPECGAKITDGKVEKLYNLVGTNDAVQATAGNRPYVGGVIAPNEKAKMKILNRTTPSYMRFTQITRTDTDEWSLTFRCKITDMLDHCIISGSNNMIYMHYGSIALYNGTDVAIPNVYTDADLNQFVTYTLTAHGNGNLSVVKNGIAIGSATGSTAFVFAEVLRTGWFGDTYQFVGECNYIEIGGKSLSASESQNLHSFLSTEFPSIETIAVGSQQVATSNLEATVFGGTSVPEVTDNSAWAALTTPAWAHYANDVANGAIYGKLFNGYAVDTIAANAPKGFHVPSELEWTMLSEYLGGNTVSGGKMKALYGGFDNAFATNESGVSILPAGIRYINGTSAEVGINGYTWVDKIGPAYFLVTNGTTNGSHGTYSEVAGLPVRLFSNTPHIEKLTYDSGWFATDIASSPKSIRIPFGCKVTNIKCITTTSVTAIEAKLFNYAGTELETLITGKACNATTKSFSVTADQSVSYTDNYVRVTAANNGGTQGMIIYVTIEPC